MKKNDVRRKYKLYYEYLNASDNYRELCEWDRKRRRNPKLKVPKKFRRQKNGKLPPIVKTFIRFRNVCDAPFDKLWDEVYSKEADKRKSVREERAIRDLRGDLLLFFDQFLHEYFIQNYSQFGSEFNRNDLVNFLMEWMENSYGHRLLLVVNPTANIEQELKPKLSSLVKDFRKEHKMNQKKLGKIPNLEQLESYLRVLQLRKQKMKWREINQEFGFSMRHIYNFPKLAKRYIKLAEEGKLPGIV
jgi:hypothetical protein